MSQMQETLSMLELLKKKVLVEIDAEHKFEIDNAALDFNDQTLTEYMRREGMAYSHYSSLQATLERALEMAEIDHEVRYSEKFKHYKSEGSSDKLAEACAKCDPEVEELQRRVARIKYGVSMVKYHLKAWDKNHDNAQSTGHMIRKEMDLGARKFKEDVLLNLTDMESR